MIQPSDLLVSPEALQTRRWVRNLRTQIVACDVLTKIPLSWRTLSERFPIWPEFSLRSAKR